MFICSWDCESNRLTDDVCQIKKKHVYWKPHTTDQGTDQDLRQGVDFLTREAGKKLPCLHNHLSYHNNLIPPL